MKKPLFVIFFATFIALCFTGCNRVPLSTQSSLPSLIQTSPDQPSTPSDPDTGAGLAEWETVCGNFVRDGSSQYNNAVLLMKYLSNDCVLFEFRFMEGSEAEDEAHNILVYGVLIVDDEGVGFYETLPDAASPFSINFTISEDGQRVTVTHSGELSISPDGEYIFADASLEVSDLSANAIIEHLPTATTSLNSNLGAYTIKYPEALVSDWFYIVEAVFDDTGTVLAKFAIAKDLSVVFRVDDDIEPVLIFGSAQPMMDAETYVWPGENMEVPKEDECIGAPSVEPRQIVSIELEDGVVMSIGSSNQLAASLPWNIPYSITAESSNKTVVTVDDKGVVRAIAPGVTTISGTIAVEDGVKEFSIEIFVTDVLIEEATT